MKNKLLKFYITLSFLCFNLALVAQTVPGDDTGDGNLEGDDTPLPINKKLILLVIAGVMFAFYTFMKNTKTQQQ